MSSEILICNYVEHLTLRLCPVGHGLYVRKNVRDYSYHYLAGFVGIDRGLVTVRLEKLIHPEWASRDFKPVTVRVRAVNCYLWGRDERDTHDRCHWFKSLDSEAT